MNCSELNCSEAVNKLSELNKGVNTEGAAAHHCSLAALTNQKKPLAGVLRNRCS